MPLMPTVRQLEYLVAIADTLHFGRAATACNVSQPTLSHQLKALEARLGVTLIERSAIGVHLTPIGRAVADRARGILVAVRDIRALAQRAGDKLAGILRLGISPTIGPYLMPAIVAALHVEQPDLRLHIREGIPNDQARDLSRGELDMLLTPLPLSGGDLTIEPLFREPMILVGPPSHHLVGRTAVEPRELAGAQFLTMDPRDHYHRMVEKICEELDAVVLRDYEGTSLDSIRQMVGSGIGIAVLPALYIRSEVGGEDMVRRINVKGWSATRSIAAAWRTGAPYADAYHQIASRICTAATAIIDGA